MEKKEPKDWGEEEMREFLKKEGLETWKTLFEEKGITGVDLQNLDRLEEIGIEKRGDRLTISNAVIKFLGKKSQSKVINDPIHGLMELGPLLIKIMDTPQFQRLRHIKQLGGAYFVYPGASHNRFEHSVGVAHLAGELARALKSKQPELGIDERDILCVEIAGLCHDLGHGPFSHLYDGMFIPKAEQKKNKVKMDQDNSNASNKEQWKHEDASEKMFDHLVEDNGLKPLMELYDLKPEGTEENDLVFIKEIIRGAKDETPWPYEGRTEEKSFLYEIVANKLNGIDVDKFDYLARDAYHLGMQSNFDHKRFIKLARVCEVKKKSEETKKHICSRDKEVGNLYDMFHTRYCLHRRVCQHKTHKAIEFMIRDAFLEADEHIEIEGSGGEMFTLSTAINDMEAYTQLTDQVFETILHPWSSPPDGRAPELEEARRILERIVSRDLYKFVCESKLKQKEQDKMPEPNQGEQEKKPEPNQGEQEKKPEPNQGEQEKKPEPNQGEQEKKPEITQEKIGDLKAKLTKALIPVENQADNFEVSTVTFDYGMEEADPISHTYFYSKADNTTGFKIPKDQKSKLLPTTFSEKIIRVYCKDAKKVDLDVAKEIFEDWCSKNEFEVPEDREIAVQEKSQ